MRVSTVAFILSCLLFSALNTPVAGTDGIYWAQTIGDLVRRADLNGANPQVVLQPPALDDPLGIAIDAAAGKIYWAQRVIDSIHRADLSGANPQLLIQWPVADGPRAVAVDALHGKIYWVQTYQSMIRRANLDGTSPQTLIQFPEADTPVAIAVDPAGGKLYWAQTYLGMIRRANLDGTSPQTLIQFPVTDDPVAIALDPAAGKLYWAQTYQSIIGRAELTGANPTTLLQYAAVDSPVALALDTVAGKIYWAQTYGDMIRRSNLDGNGAATLLQWPNSDEITALAVQVVPEVPGSCCMIGGACRDDLGATACRNQCGMPGAVGSLCLGDADGNGSDDACPSGAANPPLAPPAPYDVAKNRYISFAPNTGTNPASFRIQRTVPSAGGWIGWVGAPNANGLSRVEPCPVSRVWPEPVVHVGDCEIVPLATFQVRATTNGISLSAAYSISTVPRPTPKYWGDTVGSFVGGMYDGPNGVVNVNDFQAVLRTFLGEPGAPHISVADVQAVSSNDPCLNRVANIADVFLIIKAFQGSAYPFETNPANCPPCP